MPTATGLMSDGAGGALRFGVVEARPRRDARRPDGGVAASLIGLRQLRMTLPSLPSALTRLSRDLSFDVGTLADSMAERIADRSWESGD